MNTCLLTNDIEETSIVNGGLRKETGIKVWKEGIPLLLDLYAEHEVCATFFFVANFAEKYPEMVRMVQQSGHEVACHGLTHDYKVAFDNMDLKQQINHLTKAKGILEDISGSEVVSFRAPALRVNKFTPQALIETGFRVDSSVAPQRADMFMTLGSRKKMVWLTAPRTPYYVASDSLARKGSTNLVEVPISSFIMPYIGTFMRVSPYITSMIRWCLYRETHNTNKVVNFLIHPNEVIYEEDLHLKTQRRADNYFSYLLSDVLRRKIKQKNLGLNALNIFEKEILFWKKKHYEFIPVAAVKSSE